MEYERLLNAIYTAANDYADATGVFPSVLHIHPITYCELAAGSLNKCDGHLYRTGDNVAMFMEFRIERDRSIPKGDILLNDSLMYGIEVKYDVLRDLYIISMVRPDGTHVGKPYLANTQEKAIAKAREIVGGLGKDYYEYKGAPTY